MRKIIKTIVLIGLIITMTIVYKLMFDKEITKKTYTDLNGNLQEEINYGELGEDGLYHLLPIN